MFFLVLRGFCFRGAAIRQMSFRNIPKFSEIVKLVDQGLPLWYSKVVPRNGPIPSQSLKVLDLVPLEDKTPTRFVQSCQPHYVYSRYETNNGVQPSMIELEKEVQVAGHMQHVQPAQQALTPCAVPLTQSLPLPPRKVTKKRKRPRRIPFNGKLDFERGVTLDEIRERINLMKLKKKQELQFDNLNVQLRKKRTNKIWKSFYSWYDEGCMYHFDEFLYPRQLLKKAFDQRRIPQFSKEDVKALGDLLSQELESGVNLSAKRLKTLRNRIMESTIIYKSYIDFAECVSETQFQTMRNKWLNYVNDEQATELQRSAKDELKKKLNKYKWKH